MSRGVVIFGSLIAALILIGLLAWNPSPTSTTASHQEPLLLYCAAGLKPAVEPAIRDYEQQTGRKVQVQYGGSGTLLSNLKVAKVGDLFLAADGFFLDLARSNDLLREVIPIARMTPVIAVARGNPKQIRGLADLLRTDVRLVLANPEAAAIGRLTRDALESRQGWRTFADRALALKTTVNDLANDLKLGAADVTFLWDANLSQYPELEALPDRPFPDLASEVAIGVLPFSRQPRQALHFARFLGARDRGLRHFQAHGYVAVEGDLWVETPELVFYSGGVNRLAIEDTLRRFEDREGVKITRVYNGCGILTAQIRAGQKPDGYFACDVSFMRTVQDDFRPSFELADTRMVIATPKDNPRALKQLADLGRPGLKIGVANEQQSALGALTADLLRRHQLFDRVMSNVVVQTPTADLLVNQLRVGGLDAVVVYEVNTRQVADQIGVQPIDLPGATAIQPVAIGRTTSHPRLMERLLSALRSAESRQRFKDAGFHWRDTQP
ncbi:MAG: substrate-binding domain-containing protein [Verrucomicrobiales bacterium]|nr:substrate-binding domain-containing protein [Verrucomicrobiales bacterium]